MSKKIILCCDVCGSRNYSVPAQKNHSTNRLSVKKFCKHCNAHAMHRQTV